MDEKIFAKTVRFLALRPRTEQEVRVFLQKQNVTEDQRESMIADLKKRKFIDDEAFAGQWIEERMRLKPKGWRVLEIELRQKGVSEETIKNQETRLRQGFGGQGEKDVIQVLVAKKIKGLQGKSKEEIQRKLGGFLIRRGFTFHDSKRAIDEVLKKRV